MTNKCNSDVHLSKVKKKDIKCISTARLSKYVNRTDIGKIKRKLAREELIRRRNHE